MKVATVQLTLAELQTALNEYCFKHGTHQPDMVVIESYNKAVITVEMWPQGRVTALEFSHRSRE